MSQYCPLCGSSKSEDDLFCDKCSSKIEKEYEVEVDAKKEEPKVDVEPNFEEKPKKPRGAKTLITIISVAVALVVGFFVFKETVIEGNKEKSQWNEAVKENTISAYLEYMIAFPKGKNYNEAETIIMNLKRTESDIWQGLQTSDNSAELKDFLELHPQTPYKPLIRKRLDSLSWCASIRDNTKESYSRYLNQSSGGEFDGYYMNKAKERLYILTQRYPVDSNELDSIKQAVDGFFVGLSDINAASLEKHLAPRVFQFFNIGGGSREKIVGDLLISGSKKQSPTIKFIPDISSITYEKTIIDHYKVNVPLQKISTNTDGTDDNKYGYIEKIELDSNFQILTIEEMRPN